MFKKGDPRINRSGRPKGSKDHKWTNLQFWFNLLEEELAKKIHVTRYTKDGLFVDKWTEDAVKADTRARIFLDAMKMLVSKMQEIPKDPQASVQRIDEVMSQLKDLEKQAQTPESSPKESELSSESNRIEHPKTDNG